MCFGEGVLEVVLPDGQMNSWVRGLPGDLVNFLACIFVKMKSFENVL